MKIKDCKLVFHTIHHDSRGFFSQIFQPEDFECFFNRAVQNTFLQQNFVVTKKRLTFRGLHSQLDPYSQGKVVTCLTGSVIDVVVDLRKESPSYLETDYFVLSAEQPSSLYVPHGCLHGYLTLTDDVEISYLVNNRYMVDMELTYSPFTLELFDFINLTEIIISEKDLNGKLLKEENF
jgi:dTDP-4-dehydrorhamnose 3,5-epimerase